MPILRGILANGYFIWRARCTGPRSSYLMEPQFGRSELYALGVTRSLALRFWRNGAHRRARKISPAPLYFPSHE